MSLSSYINSTSDKCKVSLKSDTVIDTYKSSLALLVGTNNEVMPRDRAVEEVLNGTFNADHYDIEDNLKTWAYFKDSQNSYIMELLIGLVSHIRADISKYLKLRAVTTVKEGKTVMAKKKNTDILVDIDTIIHKSGHHEVSVIEAYTVKENQSYRNLLVRLLAGTRWVITQEVYMFVHEECSQKMREALDKYYIVKDN